MIYSDKLTRIQRNYELTLRHEMDFASKFLCLEGDGVLHSQDNTPQSMQEGLVLISGPFIIIWYIFVLLDASSISFFDGFSSFFFDIILLFRVQLSFPSGSGNSSWTEGHMATLVLTDSRFVFYFVSSHRDIYMSYNWHDDKLDLLWK